jgi:hypothetical protein
MNTSPLFYHIGIVCLKHDGTRAETRFCLSPKRMSPFKSAGSSDQSTTGSRGVRISGSNAGYTTFRGRARVLATHSIRQFPLHFPSRASPCAIRFQNALKNFFRHLPQQTARFSKPNGRRIHPTLEATSGPQHRRCL